MNLCRIDETGGMLDQLEMELCEILGLEWTETMWGDIQNAVRELKNSSSEGVQPTERQH